uniref:Uncharacterized protein n=1 Tax=Anguilla anguilla TaxID=7936 RepID=A0A0E9PY70_ANGAN
MLSALRCPPCMMPKIFQFLCHAIPGLSVFM